MYSNFFDLLDIFFMGIYDTVTRNYSIYIHKYLTIIPNIRIHLNSTFIMHNTFNKNVNL